MKKIIVCNQKMYLTHDEALELNNGLQNIDVKNIELILCPSYLNFDVFKDYTLGAQNGFYENKGAYTGEVSMYDLSLRGIKYVLIGHSERRKYDTLEEINLKVKSALVNSITPILCIGETKEEKEMMKTASVLKKQISTALNGVSLEDYQQILIAYEPRYLIGSKKAMKKEEIIDTCKYLESVLKELGIVNYKLLYGGAVNPSCFNEINNDYIDGFLLGSSSCYIDDLKKIISCIK